MRLVVDTSIVFMLCGPRPFMKTFIDEHGLDLIAPEALFDELRMKSDRIMRFTGVGADKLAGILSQLSLSIRAFEVKEEALERARPHISHASDAPFLALALQEHVPLLSNDRHFKEQSLVKVYTLAELKALLMSPPLP